MNDDVLRNECRALKAFKDISYKKQAELLDVHYSSFHNWLHGYYSFSESRKRALKQVIDRLNKG